MDGPHLANGVIELLKNMITHTAADRPDPDKIPAYLLKEENALILIFIFQASLQQSSVPSD